MMMLPIKLVAREGGAEKKTQIAQNGKGKRILTLRAYTFFSNIVCVQEVYTSLVSQVPDMA